MIEMLIFSLKKGEIQAVYRTVKALAAKMTEEKWEFYCLEKEKTAEEFVKSGHKLDLICIDVTAAQGVSIAREFRRRNRSACMILIASPKLPPVTYVKPDIMAGSLLLRPFTDDEVQKSMEEVFQEFFRYQEPKEQGAFIIENRRGKWLVDYEQINYFESREKKIFLNTDSGEVPFYGTLDILEADLPAYFIRCHRSYVINGRKLKGLILGQNMAVLKGGFKIPVSRSYKKAIKKFI